MFDSRSACEHADRLQQLVQERLSERDESEVLQHLDSCADCRRSLEKLAADSRLWSAIPAHLADGQQELGGPGTEEFDGRDEQASPLSLELLVSYLNPTDDPRMIGRIGCYEVCGLIGQGSTGVVVKAFEPRLNRYVAIKILSPSFSENGSARKRFEREGQAVAAVSHEHVVPVYAVDEHRGIPFIVMQYIAGPSLHQRIERDGPLDTRQVVRIGIQVAQGLAAAHAQGIIHRDIKPANVMLEDNVDRVMVTDFGLARVADEAAMTRSGLIAGTPQFMSPEQARGDRIDDRSDLFSLGSTLYAACTGRSPFRAETVFGVIRRVCEEQPTPIGDIQPDIPQWLTALIAKLMSKDRNDRFESATAVADCLSEELAHLQAPSVAAPPRREWLPAPVPKKQVAARRRVTSRWAPVASATALVGAALFFVAALQQANPGDANAESQPAAQAAADAGSNRVFQPVEGQQMLVAVEERVFPAVAGGSLELKTDVGHVEVQPGDRSDVTVTTVHRIATLDENEAQELLRPHKTAYAPSNGSLKVTSKWEMETRPGRSWPKKMKGIKFVVKVPRSYGLTLTSGAGHVGVVGPVTGAVRLKSAGGHLSAGDVEGSLWAQTAGGHISAGQVLGSAEVNTSGGNITLKRVRDKLVATTSGGNITLKDVGGTVEAKTSGGNVNATLSGQPAADCELTTTGGNVHVRLGRELSLNVEAATGHGNLSAPFIQGRNRPKSVQAELNGGGPKLRVRSGGGNVSFQYTKPAAEQAADDQAAAADSRATVRLVSVSRAVGQSKCCQD